MDWIADVLDLPVRINVGSFVGETNADITQHFEIMSGEGDKWPWLMRHLPAICVEGLVILFVARKGALEDLGALLNDADYRGILSFCTFIFVYSFFTFLSFISHSLCFSLLLAHLFQIAGILHGDLPQNERDHVMANFKRGRLMILVATDVAARGLDVPDVRTVINYDAAHSIDDYVHRIGRTGRAGTKGDAYSLLTTKDDRFAADLVRTLQIAGKDVPSDLMTLAMQVTIPHSSSSQLNKGELEPTI